MRRCKPIIITGHLTIGKSHLSVNATAHPWEDWAETWAHYLHIMDMLETSHFFGLRVDPMDILKDMKAEATFDPYMLRDFETIVHTCVPLSFAVNSINRAMGVPDVSICNYSGSSTKK